MQVTPGRQPGRDLRDKHKIFSPNGNLHVCIWYLQNVLTVATKDYMTNKKTQERLLGFARHMPTIQ